MVLDESIRSYTPTVQALVIGQAKIVTTGQAVCLSPSAAPQSLMTGLTITAQSTNSGNLLIGGPGVATTLDGTGNGYPLSPGASIMAPVQSAAAIWINGAAGDFVAFRGN